MRHILTVGTIVVLFFAFHFERDAAPAESTPSALPQAAGALGAAMQGWQAEWEKTRLAAKAEGKVVIYTTAGPEIRTAFTKAVKEKHGIDLEFVTGKGIELVTKVLNERRAGLFLGDVYISGGTSTLVSLVPQGVMDVITAEFVLPEVGDASKWYGGELPYVDVERRLLGFRGSVFWSFTTNTTLVKKDELVSYKDVLKPAFKGKIAMGDPTIEGASNTFVTLASAYLMGPDYIKELVKQEPFISRDERLLTEWVARGKYSVLIGTKPDPIAEFLKAGASLLPIIPKEGSMIEPGSGTVSVINKRPHPNATKVFINWLLSKDGQTVYAEAAGIESAREDVSKAHLGAGLVREPGKKYIFGGDEFRKTAEKTLQQTKEDFQSLLK